MEIKKILVGTSSFAALDKSPLNILLESGCDVVENPFKRKLTKPELLDLLGNDVKGLIAGLETLDKEVFEKSQLKVVSRCGSGMSNVDLKAAQELGVKVYSTPFGPTNAVAELSMGCLLTLLRQVPIMNISLHGGEWNKRVGVELCGKKVAIIGFGRIGQAVARLLLAFGAKVYAVDPVNDDCVEGVERVLLNDILPQADIITIHASGEKPILGKHEFEIIKEGSYILNAARGGVVDENCLLEALDSGKIAGAWIDSFVQEPYQGPLCEYKQVILTPHIGSYTYECRKKMETEAVENLLKGLTLAT